MDGSALTVVERMLSSWLKPLRIIFQAFCLHGRQMQPWNLLPLTTGKICSFIFVWRPGLLSNLMCFSWLTALSSTLTLSPLFLDTSLRKFDSCLAVWWILGCRFTDSGTTAPGWQVVARLRVSRGFARTFLSWSDCLTTVGYGFIWKDDPQPSGKWSYPMTWQKKSTNFFVGVPNFGACFKWKTSHQRC